jgi:hypothetical protein
MRPLAEFVGLPKEFWATVRTVSEQAGYTDGPGFLVPTSNSLVQTFRSLDLDPSDLVLDEELTDAGERLVAYLQYRGDVLSNRVHGWLMNADEAEELYARMVRQYRPQSKQPRNNQGKAKGAPRYFTCIINMLIESVVGLDCDFDPQKLTAVTVGRKPLRTLARRVDGAYPSAVNPIALWEIKEYYHTTTFGSRVADGVYESLLDGMELEEMREHTQVNVLHYLMIDARDNWWDKGRSYLCKIVDMLHMGYVDEVLFGREVVARLPELAEDWRRLKPVATARAATEKRVL